MDDTINNSNEMDNDAMHWSYWWDKIPIWDGDFADYQDIEDIYNTLMCFLCVICAGLAAGLTMGLLSLDITKLEIKAMIGSDIEKKSALIIIPIVKQHHLLLVTLLLFNSLANEALPVFLGSLVPNYLAILISVTLILFFGEILPSAFFTGPGQLEMAAKMSPLVTSLMVIFWPIAYPISRALDKVFGEEETSSYMSRDELHALMTLQQGKEDDSGIKVDVETSSISQYEVQMLTGILKLTKVTVAEVMIPIDSVFKLSNHVVLDSAALQSILNSGFSRIPVYKNNNNKHILGYLLVKSLAIIDPHEGVGINKIPLRQPIFVRPNLPLLDMLNIFKTGRSHLALVSTDPIDNNNFSEHILGMVTLEDVMEKMLQHDITDETDVVSSGSSNKVNTTLVYHQVNKHRLSGGNNHEADSSSSQEFLPIIEKKRASPISFAQGLFNGTKYDRLPSSNNYELPTYGATTSTND